MSVVISDNFSRQKGANWFPKIHGKEILLIGAGGISSWTAILLARTGVNLYIYDFDHVESHNVGGQLYKNSDLRKPKVEALSAIITEFCDQGIQVEVFPERYVESSPSNPIVITGVDNMSSRRIAFLNWQEFLKNNPSEVENALFIDGRLESESYSVFCIRGTDLEAQVKYEKEALFSDAEVEEPQCTLKQTSFMSAMIGGTIVSFLVNFFGEDFRAVPYFFRYDSIINFSTNEYN